MSQLLLTATGFVVLLSTIIAYVYQRDLPEPPPKIVGIDLGTTFSSIGYYHAVSGKAEILGDVQGRKSIPSVVAFLANGTILVGHTAVAQSEHNPLATIYDAKRFIGKTFTKEEFKLETDRYPFRISLDSDGLATFHIQLDNQEKVYYPEDIGAIITRYLLSFYDGKMHKAILTVPAEFDEQRRNASAKALQLAGLEVYRMISEPTAAALAYGLHLKPQIDIVVVIDLGGGTLDVSVLWLQSNMFITNAMAGNNRLGGQDFNERILRHLVKQVESSNGSKGVFDDPEDLQTLRLAVESAKIELSSKKTTQIDVHLNTAGHFTYQLTRDEFEKINDWLIESILQPISAALHDAKLDIKEVDEIVLVGGSTRMPAVRKVIGQYFGLVPNYGVDPELAVVTGAAVQAGVVGNSWPLQVAALELPVNARKIHVYTDHTSNDGDL